MIPVEYKYSLTHEWVFYDKEAKVTKIGITEYIHKQTGDIIFLEHKEKNEYITKNDEIAIAESVEHIKRINTPVSGLIVAVNPIVIRNPSQINYDCYDKGWIFEIKGTLDQAEWEGLMDADEYLAYIS